VRAPNGKSSLPETLDVDAMARLLAIRGDTLVAVRDRAMLELIYSSGLRLAEVHDLNLADLDCGGSVRVIGKGGKQRVVPVGRPACTALKAWLKRRQTLVDDSQLAVFVSRRASRLSRRAIQQRVSHWARETGLMQRVYPHLFRHSFASHLLESSGDLRAVQELLGHANISTTQIYTHLNFQHLADVYDQAHPRARRKSR